MLKSLVTAALSLAAIAVVPAQANVYLYSSNILDNGAASPGADLGVTNTFTVGGLSIVAKAFAISGGPFDLFGKNGGTDETGLGLTGDTDHEIDTNSFIQLDFADPTVNNPKKYNVTQVTIQFASVQAGETWSLYGSNTAGTAPGTGDSALLIGNSGSESVLTIPNFSMYRYFMATAGGTGGHNVLIGQIEVTATTPEPVTSLLMGGALLAMGLGARKLRRRG